MRGEEEGELAAIGALADEDRNFHLERIARQNRLLADQLALEKQLLVCDSPNKPYAFSLLINVLTLAESEGVRVDAHGKCPIKTSAGPSPKGSNRAPLVFVEPRRHRRKQCRNEFPHAQGEFEAAEPIYQG